MILGVLYLLIEGLCQIFITPLLLKSYPSGDVGLWMVVTNFLVLIQLGQAGLAPISVRALASASMAGGGAWDTEYKLVARAYSAACVLLAIILICVAFYIANVAARVGYHSWRMLWVFVAVGMLLRMYSWRWLSALNALGYVGMDKTLAIVNSILCYGAYAGIAVMHMPLTILGGAYAALGGVYLILSYLIFRRYCNIRGNALEQSGSVQVPGLPEVDRTLRTYALESARFLVLNASGFLVLNVDVVIVERIFGASVVPYFSILVKLGFLVLSVATLTQSMSYPFVAREWAGGNRTNARKIYRIGLAISLGIVVVGIGTLLVSAPVLIRHWLGAGSYLGTSVFATQLLFVLISAHTIAQATPALATGEVHFTDLAVWSAALAVPLSWILGVALGLPGVGLGNALGTIVPSVLHGLRAHRLFNREKSREVLPSL